MIAGITQSVRKRYEGYVRLVKTCSVEGCEKPADARGWCRMHYVRWQTRGTTDYAPPTPEERFWSRVEKTDNCWYWTGRRNDSGYGVIAINKKQVRAHRFSYFLHYGEWPMPEGRHICDTPACVRPDHIVPGTHAQNMRDMQKRRRHAHGERNASSRLKEEEVRAIKQLLAQGVKQSVIAQKFRIAPPHVSKINTGQVWAHVKLTEDEE